MKRAWIMALLLLPTGVASCVSGCQQPSEVELIHKVKDLQEKLMNEEDSAQRELVTLQYVSLVDNNLDGVVMTNMAPRYARIHSDRAP